MPRLLPPDLAQLLGRSDRNIETHSTLILFLPTEVTTISYFFATANLTIRGVPFLGYLRETGVVRSSLTRAVDRAEATVANEDTIFGRELIDIQEGLFGTEARLGRYWRDVDSGAEFQEDILQGVVSAVDVSESVIRLTLVSDAYAATSVGASRRVAKTCQWRFRDPLTCQYSGNEIVCNYLLNDSGGCQGRHGDPLKRAKYGGFAYIESKTSLTAEEGQSVPAYNQLIQSSASPLSSYIQYPITKYGSGFKISNNTILKRSEIDVNAVQAIPITAFGAVGDATTDNTAALNDAINFRGRLFIPAGRFKFSGTINLPNTIDQRGLMLEGAGITESILEYTGTGNAFDGANRTDFMRFQHFRLESTNASNTGNGFNFSTTTAVQTHCKFYDVAVFGFGGWGIYSLNLQSSVIDNCHIRDCNKGCIGIIDDSLGEFSRIPNTNRITNCLLDNCPTHADNVAMVRVFNSGDLLIAGNTIQGHWLNGGAAKPAIHLEQCRNGNLISNHIESSGTVNEGGVVLTLCRSLTLIATSGGGGHNVGIRLIGCRGITMISCGVDDTTTTTPYLIDTESRDTTIIGGTYGDPAHTTRADESADGMRQIGASFHNQNDSKVMRVTDAIKDNRISAKNLVVNGNFTTDLSSWSGSLTGISRVASGTPPFNLPYVLCNTQSQSDSGESLVFHQTYSIPDVMPPGVLTLCFKFYVEAYGASNNAGRFVKVEFNPSGSTGLQVFRINAQDTNKYDIGRWYTAMITDAFTSGTGRTAQFGILPTMGSDTPRVRFAEFYLVQGKEALRDVDFSAGGGSGLGDPGGNGYVVRTALNTTTNRTITAGTGISVTNGDGQSGNTTIASTVVSAITDCVVVTTTNGSVGDDSPTTLHSLSPGGGYLAADGDFLEIEVAGINSATAASKRIEYLYAGVNIFDTGHITTSLDSKHWRGKALIVRLSSTTARAVCHFATSDNGSGVISWSNNIVTTSFSATHSSNNAFAVRATSGNTGTGVNDDIIQYLTVMKRGIS